VGADVSIPNNHGLTPLEVINRYTDPRSGHNLKQLLQSKMFSNLHSCFNVLLLGAVDHAAKMKQQQQLRPNTPPQPLSRPPSSRSHHQIHHQHSESPSDPYPPYSPNQPQAPSQPHPPHQSQSLDQPPNWKPEEPRGYTIGGNPSLAAMIAAKAASRKPMMTSPTKKESTDQGLSSSQTVGHNSYQHHQVRLCYSI